MSESYTYGGNGSLERVEYNKLNERDLSMYIEMVSDELESFFLCAQPSPEVDNTFEKTEEKLSRSIDFSYLTTASDPETTYVFDLTSGVLAEYNPPITPIKNSVEIVYSQYAKGLICEEYIVNIDRTDAGTKGSFLSRYHFNRYPGNHWQASVKHNDIKHDNFNLLRRENNGKYYSREMTPYDFDEFFKDTAEINTQLRMRLVQ
jgi:hypothetical protein